VIRRAGLCAAALAACSLGAFADDDATGEEPPEAPKVTGDVRTGWRFLSNEGEGRFYQDWALTEGPKLFSLNLLATDPEARTGFDEAEVHVSGVGDPMTDTFLALRRNGVFEIEGSWRRDDLSYDATGDPFQYDTVRERSSLHGLWTPDKDFALRASWDRDQREGDAFTGAYYSFDGTSVRQHRLFETVSDRFSMGADWAVDVFRFGVTQTVGLTDVSDKRTFDAPPGDTSAESTDRTVRAEAYTTAARAGVSLLEGDLESTVFMTRTHLPMEESVTGSQTDDSGNVTPTSGSGELTREALAWRWETLWRFHPDWEVTLAAEREDVADDEDGQYLFGTFVQSAAFARVTDRTRRYSADFAWDATDELRLRVAEQYLHEELFVPTDSHFTVPPPDQARRNRPTDLQSDAWRTTAGADWKPVPRLTLSALTYFTAESDPQTTPLPEKSNEYSLRVRWKPQDELALTTYARRTSLAQKGAVPLYDLGHVPTNGEDQTTDLNSATRATSVAQSVGWNCGPWNVTATASWRKFDTSTDTAWGAVDNTLLTFETVAFRGSDVTLSLDAHYELTKTLRLIANGTRTSTNGDYTARWLTASLGAEYDIAEAVTLGATLQSWRFDEKHNSQDDYGVYGVEVSLTYWFR
jgi:hypothetical protein